jgi:hypothetical protein
MPNNQPNQPSSLLILAIKVVMDLLTDCIQGFTGMKKAWFLEANRISKLVAFMVQVNMVV